MCLLDQRRAVLRAIGPFDEERFGLGYGEENDFCMRASRAGFVHVLDDATFVYHAGQRSFGAVAPGAARGRPCASLTRAHPELPAPDRRVHEGGPAARGARSG